MSASGETSPRAACAGAALAVACLAAWPLAAQQAPVRPTTLTRAPMLQGPVQGEVEVLPVRGNIYVLFGAGNNITFSVGFDGALLVDAGRPEMADKVITAVRRTHAEWLDLNRPRSLGFGAETRSSVADRAILAPPKPIRYIVNTHAHADAAGANEPLRNAGRTFTGGNVAGNIADAGEGAAILAHENVLKRLSAPGEGKPAPHPDALPTDTYYVESYKLSQFFNGEGIQLINVPAAHSDGDSLVHFRGNDVIALGDIMSTRTFPVIDLDAGGSINGIIDGLNRVLDMAIAEFRLEGGTMMVPGEGRVVDSGDVAYYRDMVTIVRDRVLDLVKKGRTLEEVKASRPTQDYPHFQASTGPWTTDMFVEAVYRSLGGGKVPAPAPVTDRNPSRGEALAVCRGIAAILLALATASGALLAQQAQPPAAPPTPRAQSPVDLTGQWVSLVTDDWRWRMVTPPKGDVLYLPVNEAGRKMATDWDAARDAAAGEACRAYGAGGIMHMPGRLRISWENDTTLKLETDTGQQTRLFNFGNTVQAPAEATFQGFSRAAWELPGGGGGRGRGRGAAGPRPGASLRVNTTRMKLGYFRRNGVPYGANATLTEWFTTLSEPDGNTYLLVTNILEDPQYLNAPYVRSVQFKKENGTAGWNPTPCQ